jgi:LuxR family maltose regulon positive regulatory protein
MNVRTGSEASASRDVEGGVEGEAQDVARLGVDVWTRSAATRRRARRPTAPVGTARHSPPQLPQVSVRRGRLLAALDMAVRSRVTLVVAPTGCGKTVLLSQWVASHPRRRIQWLTADPHDNDPQRFAARLRSALESAELAPESAADGRVTPPVVLILDDAHLISNTLSFDELEAQLEDTPGLHLILSARANPGFPVHRFRLRDQVADLRQGVLTFDHAEARELLTRVGRRRITDEQVDALWQRTEGWPSGLYFASLSLSCVNDVDEFVQTFAADDRHVADYLIEGVLELQDPHVQSFLLATSVLDKMSVPLCNYVLRDSDAQAILQQLERASIVIWSLDEGGTWFRYHGLLRVLLRQHLRLTAPHLEQTLLLRAADWHLAHGGSTEVIGYLVEAGANERAVEVIREHGPHLLLEGSPKTVTDCIDSLSEAIRTTDPDVMLLELAARVSSHDLLEAGRILHQLEAIPRRPLADRMAAEALRGVWLLRQGAPKKAIAAADRALEDSGAGAAREEISRMHEHLVGQAHLVRAIAFAELGRPDEASAAVIPLLDGGPPLLVIRAYGVQALIYAQSGRLRLAIRTAGRALDLAEANGRADDPAVALALVALAIVAREQDRSDRADDALDAARLRSDGDPFVDRLIDIEKAELSFRVDPRDRERSRRLADASNG